MYLYIIIYVVSYFQQVCIVIRKKLFKIGKKNECSSCILKYINTRQQLCFMILIVNTQYSAPYTIISLYNGGDNRYLHSGICIELYRKFYSF